MFDQGLGPLLHVWIKNRTEPLTQSTALSMSRTACPTCERHHLEVPGTLFEWMGWSFLNLISLVAWKYIPLSISKTVHGYATPFL